MKAIIKLRRHVIQFQEVELEIGDGRGWELENFKAAAFTDADKDCWVNGQISEKKMTEIKVEMA